MTTEKNGNGRVGMLLWINTLLTALILPLLGFIGVRLWDAQDANGKEINKLRIEVSIIKERQMRMGESDARFEKAMEEHLKDVSTRPKP